MPGEALCGIETDKAVIDYEMQEEGYIAKIVYPDGTKDIALGEVIAILVEEEEDVAAFANYTGEAAPAQAAPAKAAPAKAAPAAPAKSYPDHIVLEMPNLSPTMEKVSRQKSYLYLG
jgi:pyruvate dehydrogenase E2 component (dihydrolipoamide acetyltransferase)